MTQTSGAILVAQAAATEDAGGADAGGGGGAGAAEGGAAGEPPGAGAGAGAAPGAWPEPGAEPPADLSALWDMDGADYECDCPGPPPEFRLPPPPRPPFLQESDCSEGPLLDLETCDAVPVIDAEFHSSPAIPSLAVIVVCSVLLAAMVLIASVLVWKHKRKMQNFLPCKTSPQNRCDVSNGNGVIYEDLTNIRPRTLPNHCATGQTAPSIEMIDVKGPASAGYGGAGNIFVCQAAPRAEPYASQDLYNPVYEELSNGSGERPDSEPESEALAGGSEDEFADEELSLGGDADAAGAGSGGSGGGAGSNSASGSASAADANSLSGASAASDDAPTRAHPPPPSARRAAPHAHAHAHPHALAHSHSHAPHALPPLVQHHAPLQPLPADADAERRASARHRFAQHVQSADSLATVGVDERGRYTLASPGAGVRGGAYGAPPPGYRTEGGGGGGRSGRQGAAAAERRPRSLDRRRAWRTKAPAQQAPPPPLPPAAAVAAAAAAAAQGHEFHEGLLLDALLQLYPSVGVGAGGGGGGRAGRNAPPSGHAHAPVPSVAHRLPYLMPPLAAAAAAPALPAPPRTHLVNPYESVPVLNHLHQHHHHHGGSGGGPAGHAHPHAYAPPQRPDMFSTFRPAPPSQDSSFGSDSGYSNHTSGGGGGGGGGTGGGGGGGGGGGRSGSRGRKESHRLSAHSGDLVIS
ncbi:hypothetical protein R5R35_001179 [Gryllus longicercus]|uniref:Uncharacterized protein n=1 Tax=Gryllus longicercus TaxID=2509291 RepID=A0AAN9VN51_9ORTH